MGRNTYLNIILTLLTLIVAFFAWQILASLDRVRFSNEKLLEAVRQMPQNNASYAATATPVPTAEGDFANAEFFAPDAVPGDRFVTAIGADMANLNTLICNDAGLSRIAGFCNTALGERNYAKPEKFEPILAEEVIPSDDHLSYRVKLCKNIKWHDFTDPVTNRQFKDVPVTAYDFQFFFDVVNNPDVNCAPVRSLFGAMTGIEVINDYEFVVKWREPFFRTTELTWGLQPLPRHLYLPEGGEFDGEKFNDDHVRNNMLVGCGPYKLKEYQKNRRIVLERNPDYIGSQYKAMPSLQYLVFEIVANPNTQFQMLTAGELDQLGLTPEQWTERTNTPMFAENGTLRKYSYTRPAYFYIGWNRKNACFQDRKVRTALTMLCDRERILNDVFSGRGQVISGPFFVNSPAYDRNIKPWPFDVAAAQNLLAEAGWVDADNDGVLEKDGQKFVFTLMYPADQPLYERMLAIFKEGLAKAGIDMRMQAYEWSVFTQKVDQRNFDAYTMGWSLPVEADPFQVWHSSQADTESGSNYIDFKEPEADNLITAIRREFDADKRIELCHEFHQFIHDDQPYTFLVSPDALQAISNRYKNFKLFYFGVANDLLWTPKAQQNNQIEQ